MAREPLPQKARWPWARGCKQSPDSALEASHRALTSLQSGSDAPPMTSISVYRLAPQAGANSAQHGVPARQSEQQPLLIEVIGLPGSGKTTLISESGFSKADASASAEGSALLRPWSGRWLLRAPLFATLVISAALHRRIYARSALRKCITVVRRYVELRDVRGAAAAVIDEGPTHALFTLFFGSEPSFLSQRLERRLLAKIAGRIGYFLYVDISPEECAARLQSRDAPHSRFNVSTAPEITQALLTDRTYSAIRASLSVVATDRVKSCNNLKSCCSLLLTLATGGWGQSEMELRTTR